MPKQLLLIWILALAYLSTANAQPFMQLNVTPAWNGYYKPGEPTELSLQLLSNRGGTVTAQTGQLLTTVELTANTPQSLSIPLLPDQLTSTQSIRAYRQDDPGVFATQNLSLTASDSRMVAFVSDQLSVEERRLISQNVLNGDKTVFLAINSTSLPQLGSGYAAIDLLVMSYTDLKTLKDRQINALSSYLTLCGKMIAVAFPETVYKQLQSTAGCHGEFLIGAPSIADVSQRIQTLIGRIASPLPDPASLPTHVRQTSFFSPGVLLVIFSFGYLMLVLMTAFLNKNKTSFILLPVLAAGIAILLWYRQQPESYLVSWLEMDSGQSSARYIASLKMQGTGKWRDAIELPVESKFSTTSSNPHPTQSNVLNPDTVSTRVEFSLLSSAQWHWQASLDVKAPLEIITDGDKLTVGNISQQATEAGLLRWQDHIYHLPVLAGGQRWSPDTSTTAPHTELVQLFAQQSRQSTIAILIPYRANILQFNTRQLGWLLIHYPKASGA